MSCTLAAVAVIYVAQRILAQNGFKRLTVYPGGVRFYQPTHDAANK